MALACVVSIFAEWVERLVRLPEEGVGERLRRRLRTPLPLEPTPIPVIVSSTGVQHTVTLTLMVD